MTPPAIAAGEPLDPARKGVTDMAILDLQAMEPENSMGGGGSNVSLLLCDKHSSHSTIACL